VQCSAKASARGSSPFFTATEREPIAVASLRARALSGLPELNAGDDLAALIAGVAHEEPMSDGQLVVIAHKAVSKCEGAVVALADIHPGAQALDLAAQAAAAGQPRDPRALQVVLDQSSEILRAERGVLICRTHHGFVCANAGVDASNAAEDETLIVLPRDPDGSARRLRARLRELTGASVGVLITDSFGRAWRNGQVDVAIGLAGMRPLEDWRGRSDARGMELRATWLAAADAAAAIGELVRAKDSREPVTIVEGLERLLVAEDGPGAQPLLRALEEDMFR
jgi:coenzyme F420-0:L-glutamate ligase / coenzyme F420-1:gamma-L-glutamate ligase